MLVNVILSVFNTTELYSVFVNNYLVDHSDYTNVSDLHIYLVHTFLRKIIAFLEHTNKTVFIISTFYISVKKSVNDIIHLECCCTSC